MKSIIIAAILALTPAVARAAGAGCWDTAASTSTGHLILEKIRPNAPGPQFVGCINRTFDLLAASVTAANSTTSFVMAGHISVARISGLSSGAPGIWVSSSVYMSSNTYFLVAGSETISGGGGLGVTYGITAGSATANLAYFGTTARSTFSADGSLSISGNGGINLTVGDSASGGAIRFGAASDGIIDGGSGKGLNLRYGGGSGSFLYGSNAGLVGVGTTAPATQLDVNGTAQFGSGATKSTFSAIGTLTLASGASLNYNTTVTTGAINIGNIGSGANTIYSDEIDLVGGGVKMGTNLIRDQFVFYHSNSQTNRNLFFAYAGKVGISTGVPKSTLDVNGNAEFGSGGTKSSFTTLGALRIAYNAAIDLQGPSGNIINYSSVNSSGFFGTSADLSIARVTHVVGSSGTFTAVGDAAYSIRSSSGIYIIAGGVRWPDGTVSTTAVTQGSGGGGGGGETNTFTSSKTIIGADASGYTLSLSSGLTMSAGSVLANQFTGNGANVSAISYSNITRSLPSANYILRSAGTSLDSTDELQYNSSDDCLRVGSVACDATYDAIRLTKNQATGSRFRVSNTNSNGAIIQMVCATWGCLNVTAGGPGAAYAPPNEVANSGAIFGGGVNLYIGTAGDAVTSLWANGYESVMLGPLGGAQIGRGVTKTTITATGDWIGASNSSMTLTGANGFIQLGSSVTTTGGIFGTTVKGTATGSDNYAVSTASGLAITSGTITMPGGIIRASALCINTGGVLSVCTGLVGADGTCTCK